MKIPLEITFRNVTKTSAIEHRIRAKAAKLDQRYDRILACRVVVESRHRHSHKGNKYQVHIEVSVPKGELVINRDPSDRQAHEDLGVAIRDAFLAAQRKLDSFTRRRNASKSHTNMRISEVLHA